jgi:hypothetical protein
MRFQYLRENVMVEATVKSSAVVVPEAAQQSVAGFQVIDRALHGGDHGSPHTLPLRVRGIPRWKGSEDFDAQK